MGRLRESFSSQDSRLRLSVSLGVFYLCHRVWHRGCAHRHRPGCFGPHVCRLCRRGHAFAAPTICNLVMRCQFLATNPDMLTWQFGPEANNSHASFTATLPIPYLYHNYFAHHLLIASDRCLSRVRSSAPPNAESSLRFIYLESAEYRLNGKQLGVSATWRRCLSI